METTKSLTRIVSPTLNDANIASSLSEAINVINENFRILSSTPFLQGVKGDTYHTSTQYIFELKNDIVTATSAGALLLNSIFGLSGDNTIKKGDKYKEENGVKDKIQKAVGDSSVLGCPTDSLIEFENDIPVKLVNNDLYFYTLIDDAGNEYGEQLGQYYYFIDNRIKNLGTAYNKEDKTDLIKFVDYSGFYRYVPANDTDEAHYEKVGFLPSLYYDTKNNDICWKYYDEETGLSAIGPKGATGDSSVLKIVRIDNPIDGQTYGEINAVTTTKDILLNENSMWSTAEIAKIEENTPLIICFKNGTKYDISFGIAKKIKIESQQKICGVWDTNSVLDTSINTKTINEYFESINNTGNNDDPKYLKIPYGIKDNKTNHDSRMHTLRGDASSGLLLRSSGFTNGRFILDDYSIVCTTYDGNNENTSKCTSISNNGITVNSSNGNIIISDGSISLSNIALGNIENSMDDCANFSKYITAGVGFTWNKPESFSSATTGSYENNYIGMPIGSIIMYYGYISNVNSDSVVSVGNCWLLCNGALLTGRNEKLYKKLIDKTGITKLPDFRNLYPRGCGNSTSGLVGYKGGQNDIKIKYETGNKIKTSGGIGIPDTNISDIGFYVNDSKNGTTTKYQRKRVGRDVIYDFAATETNAGIGVINSSECTIPTEPTYITVNFLIKYR